TRAHSRPTASAVNIQLRYAQIPQSTPAALPLEQHRQRCVLGHCDGRYVVHYHDEVLAHVCSVASDWPGTTARVVALRNRETSVIPWTSVTQFYWIGKFAEDRLT